MRKHLFILQALWKFQNVIAALTGSQAIAAVFMVLAAHKCNDSGEGGGVINFFGPKRQMVYGRQNFGGFGL